MWKRVLSAEVQEEVQKEEQNCISSPADPITAIHEEEEEQASKEELPTDGVDEEEIVLATEEEEILLQSETSQEKEEVPEWYYGLPLKPGIGTLSKNVYIFPNLTLDMVASTSLWHNTVEEVLGNMCLTKTGFEDRDDAVHLTEFVCGE